MYSWKYSGLIHEDIRTNSIQVPSTGQDYQEESLKGKGRDALEETRSTNPVFSEHSMDPVQYSSCGTTLDDNIVGQMI